MSYQNSDPQYMSIVMNERAVSQPWFTSFKAWLKILILLCIITFIVLAIVYNKMSGTVLSAFLIWMADNPVGGPLAFICLYWICTVAFVPVCLLTLAAGFVFRAVAGPWTGIFLATAIVLVGASLGASTAFLLGRFVFRQQVEGLRAKYELFEIVDEVVMDQGLKATLLMRLSPVIPFNSFNYIMGLTGVRFRDFCIAHIGMIPGTLAMCLVGGTLGAIGDSVRFSNSKVLIFTIASTVVAMICTIYISFVAQTKFNRIAARQQPLREESVSLTA